MATYSQGICGDGAAILEDGRMMTVDEIVARLNELDEIKSKSCIVELSSEEKDRAIRNLINDMYEGVEG